MDVFIFILFKIFFASRPDMWSADISVIESLILKFLVLY
jgi:hypothetical protein